MNNQVVVVIGSGTAGLSDAIAKLSALSGIRIIEVESLTQSIIDEFARQEYETSLVAAPVELGMSEMRNLLSNLPKLQVVEREEKPAKVHPDAKFVKGKPVVKDWLFYKTGGKIK